MKSERVFLNDAQIEHTGGQNRKLGWFVWTERELPHPF
jgi:hypothetical protein